MVRTERLLRDRQRALVQRLGLRIAALGAMELCKVVAGCADLDIVRAELTFGRGECAFGAALAVGEIQQKAIDNYGDLPRIVRRVTIE